VTTAQLDTHVLLWWSAEPEGVSAKAAAIEAADELAVALITWFELAWLAHQQRIVVSMPGRSWLEVLAAGVRTVPVSPAIAAAAAVVEHAGRS